MEPTRAEVGNPAGVSAYCDALVGGTVTEESVYPDAVNVAVAETG